MISFATLRVIHRQAASPRVPPLDPGGSALVCNINNIRQNIKLNYACKMGWIGESVSISFVIVWIMQAKDVSFTHIIVILLVVNQIRCTSNF